MIQIFLDQHNLSQHTEIYQLPDFPDDAQRLQHIADKLPAFTHIISDNPQVTDLFPDRHIIQPENRILIRASDIRQAIIDQNHTIINQFLSPEIIHYLQEIDAHNRLTKNTTIS